MKGAKLYHGRYVACRSGVTAGAALILTLACIVILTALVLLFLTHSLLETQVSVASADQTAASLFARGAVDSVVGELKQEIAAGSATPFIPAGSDLRDPNTVFLPTTNQAMVPYRMDAGAPANVLKRSSYNEPFYAGSFYNTTTWPAPQWAVNFSSTNPGAGSRFVSMQRWNEPLLMPTALASSTDLTPTNGFIPPDWVYVTRTSGPATTWSSALIPNTVSGGLNTNCVVGRFAYVVYDEGGLLDANAAGYPSSVSASMVRHKISEACADLTQIGLNSSDINSLVTWRNPANSASATQYTNYVYSMCTNAFLTPAVDGGVTERLFTSRQQLIDFLTQNVAANNPSDVERMQGALPYLTTFSRELNAPSWYPQTNMTAGGYSYLTIATNTPSSATNAFAPLERATTMYTNVSGIVCNANQPAAFSRFPLSRLSWLTPTGPATIAGITAAQLKTDIQESFGLVWDSANTAWTYAGPTGSTTLSSIPQLSIIHGREPNFFEILKAAILSGSVNIVPDTQQFPAPLNSTFPNFGGIDTRYGNINSSGDEVPVSDQQIMQIGLSAIDQASPAALPTRAEFAANVSSDWSGALYGNKSLPYLYKMAFSPYRPTTAPLDGTNTQQYFTGWEEPVFWNPYQTVNTNTAGLQIRVRADGTNNGVAGNIGAVTVAANATWSGGAAASVSETCSPELACGPAGASTGPGGANGASIELDSTSTGSFDSLAANPILLSSLMADGYTPVFNDLRAQSPIVWPTQANADTYTEGGVTYAGFWLGMILAPDSPDPNHEVVYASGSPTTTPAPFAQSYFYSGTSGHRSIQAFVLEANYGTTGSPNFQEIQRLRTQYTSGAAVEEFDNFTVLQRRMDFFTVNDPRTGRFSYDIMQPSDYNPSAPGPTATMTPLDSLSPTWTTFESTTNNAFAGINVSGQLRGITRCSISSPTTTITPSIGAQQSPGKTPVPYVNTFRWADNTASAPGIDTPAYSDTDGAQRPADGWWSSATANTLPMREDGAQYRPVMLNRGFYSVGELGYVFRDMPWKSLDLSTPSSADAGLLDYFCINDGYAGSTNAPVVAGVLNLNTTHPQVLQAMLNGTARAQLYPTFDVSASDAASMANAITNLTGNVPLLNKSELATRVAPADPTVLTNATTEPGIDTNIKERREAIVRALASVGQVRTWNLMIDVVAQTGHLPPNATGFNSFLVTAEQRYWAHVAIDRFTGQVVSIQLEPVSE